MTPQQQKEFSQVEKLKRNVKSERVKNYLGSEGFKSSINFGEEKLNSMDKITNSNISNSIFTFDSEPKKFLKTFRHVVKNNRVYYP